jgi:hypothetical protein
MFVCANVVYEGGDDGDTVSPLEHIAENTHPKELKELIK